MSRLRRRTIRSNQYCTSTNPYNPDQDWNVVLDTIVAPIEPGRVLSCCRVSYVTSPPRLSVALSSKGKTEECGAEQTQLWLLVGSCVKENPQEEVLNRQPDGQNSPL